MMGDVGASPTSAGLFAPLGLATGLRVCPGMAPKPGWGDKAGVPPVELLPSKPLGIAGMFANGSSLDRVTTDPVFCANSVGGGEDTEFGKSGAEAKTGRATPSTKRSAIRSTPPLASRIRRVTRPGARARTESVLSPLSQRAKDAPRSRENVSPGASGSDRLLPTRRVIGAVWAVEEPKGAA